MDAVGQLMQDQKSNKPIVLRRGQGGDGGFLTFDATSASHGPSAT